LVLWEKNLLKPLSLGESEDDFCEISMSDCYMKTCPMNYVVLLKRFMVAGKLGAHVTGLHEAIPDRLRDLQYFHFACCGIRNTFGGESASKTGNYGLSRGVEELQK